MSSVTNPLAACIQCDCGKSITVVPVISVRRATPREIEDTWPTEDWDAELEVEAVERAAAAAEAEIEYPEEELSWANGCDDRSPSQIAADTLAWDRAAAREAWGDPEADATDPEIDAIDPEIDAIDPEIDAIDPDIDAIDPVIDAIDEVSVQDGEDVIDDPPLSSMPRGPKVAPSTPEEFFRKVFGRVDTINVGEVNIVINFDRSGSTSSRY